MRDILENVVEEAISIVQNCRNGRDNVEAQKGKRTCLAEKMVHEHFCARLYKELGEDFFMITEGFPNYGNKDSKIKVLLDPMDGTVYYARQKSANPFDISIATSVLDGPTYSDVIAGAIGDINSGEVWSSSCKGDSKSNIYGDLTTSGNESHDPIIISDFYFRGNAKARLRLKNPKNPEWVRFECLNPGSASTCLAKVACGEADACFTMGGYTHDEITSAYYLIKNAGGFVLDPLTGEDIGNSIIDFTKNRVPIICAKDEKFAKELYSFIGNIKADDTIEEH